MHTTMHKNIHTTMHTNMHATIYKLNIVPFASCGLCNQLLFIVSTMVYCYHHSISKIMIRGCLSDINTNELVPISLILNLDEINRRSPIQLIDGFQDSGPFLHPISFSHLHQSPMKSVFCKCIAFSSFIVNYSKALSFPSQVYMIHLRLEEDALLHWSKMNNLTIEEFRNKLETWYLSTLQTNVPKGSSILVLTGNINNSVWTYLQENYTVFYQPKPNIPREFAAAIDLYLAQKCNQIFIGAGGSTFTDFIIHTYAPTSILVDLNHL